MDKDGQVEAFEKLQLVVEQLTLQQGFMAREEVKKPKQEIWCSYAQGKGT